MDDITEKNINRFTLKIPAKVDQLNEVLSFVDMHLEECGCPLKTQMQFDVAIEELFVNIASYAYQSENGEAEITMTIEEDPTVAEFEFRDWGIPFDPVKKQDPDVTLTAEERQIGGLGIYMVKKSMDDIQYKRENGQNILTIRKRL